MYIDGTLPIGLNSSFGCCQHTIEAVIVIYAENGYRAVKLLDNMASAENWDRVDEADQAIEEKLNNCEREENVIKHCKKM